MAAADHEPRTAAPEAPSPATVVDGKALALRTSCCLRKTRSDQGKVEDEIGKWVSKRNGQAADE